MNLPSFKTAEVKLPTLALIAATRGMLGAGAGLLLAPRLRRRRQRVMGWTLLAVGALSTIPLALSVLSGRRGK